MSKMLNWLKDALIKSAILGLLIFGICQGFSMAPRLIASLQTATSNLPAVVAAAENFSARAAGRWLPWISHRDEQKVQLVLQSYRNEMRQLGIKLPYIKRNGELSHILILATEGEEDERDKGRYIGMQNDPGRNLLVSRLEELNRSALREGVEYFDLSDWFPDELFPLEQGATCYTEEKIPRGNLLYIDCMTVLHLKARDQLCNGLHCAGFVRNENSGIFNIFVTRQGLDLLGIENQVLYISKGDFEVLESINL